MPVPSVLGQKRFYHLLLALTFQRLMTGAKLSRLVSGVVRLLSLSDSGVLDSGVTVGLEVPK